MVVDSILNLYKYKELIAYTLPIQGFIHECERNNIEDGKYTLLEDNLIAIVQTYWTKPYIEQRMETHNQYSDLQYMMYGKEYIYWNMREILEEEENSKSLDLIFYKRQEELARIQVKAGMFAYFLPTDTHMPCVQIESSQKVRKIVFKIKNKFYL